MSLFISNPVSNEQVVQAAEVYVKASKSQRELFKECVGQFSESLQEKKHSNPQVRPRIIRQPKRKLFPFLSDIETTIFASEKAGVGSVRMSAYFKKSERQIRRILARAYEKIEEQKS